MGCGARQTRLWRCESQRGGLNLSVIASMSKLRKVCPETRENEFHETG